MNNCQGIPIMKNNRIRARAFPMNNLYSLLACLFIAVLPGCTSLDSDFETPTVTINSFRAVPSDSGAPSFEIGLRVINPNREALELQGVAYTISLEGRELVTGVGKDLPVIPAYSEGIFTVTASAKVTINASTVEISAGMVTVNAGMSKFSGVVQADTVISNSVVSASYTPGAGNIW